MSTIRRNIIKHMVVITLTMTLVVLAAVFLSQLTQKQREARETGLFLADQMDEIIRESRENIESSAAAYAEDRLIDTATVDYILLQNPAAMSNAEELQKIADLQHATEIHLFDSSGILYAGTHPSCCGVRLDEGEQLASFAPMLEDPMLRLSLPIAKSDLTGALVQYNAVWSREGDHIVMLGFPPERVQREEEKNLSNIFSLLRVREDVKLCALDKTTKQILASTNPADAEKPVTVLGIQLEDFDERNLVSGQYIFDSDVDGVSCYCIFSKMEDCLAGYIVPNDVLYSGVNKSFLAVALAVIGISIIMVLSVVWYMGRDVIMDIHSINEILGRISNGSLKRTVDIRTNREFAELSQHINEVVSSLLATTDKMSYVLSRTNVRMGVYEYSRSYGETVRYTEYIPELLGLDGRSLARLTLEGRVFEDYIKTLKQDPLPDEENVYRVMHGEEEVFLKFDDVVWRNDIFGIVVDMTKEIVMRRRIESERDIDPLTNLWNRRGVHRQFGELFKEPESMGYGVIVMVDTDDLKKINDTRGHEVGDSYLQKVADLLGQFGVRNNVSARLGGDEFVTLLYGYRSPEELAQDLDRFRAMQGSVRVTLDDGGEVTVRFSAGFSETYGQTDYHILLRAADERMYADKRARKQARSEGEN